MMMVGGGPASVSQVAGRAMASPSSSVPVMIRTVTGGRAAFPLRRRSPVTASGTGGGFRRLPLPRRRLAGTTGRFLLCGTLGLGSGGTLGCCVRGGTLGLLGAGAALGRWFGFAGFRGGCCFGCGGLLLGGASVAAAGGASGAELLALLGKQRDRLLERHVFHHDATRQIGDQLAVLRVGTEAALADRNRLLVGGMRAEIAHARHLARDQVHRTVDAECEDVVVAVE